MPELPEVEAVRVSLDEPVSAFPIERAGPAHVATLKSFDPPLQALEGRRLAGAKRRGKRLLFETEDGELVLMVHLMSAGRLRYLRAGEKGPKQPAFRLRFQGGGELVLTEAGSKKRAGVWLLTPGQVDEELSRGLELRIRGAGNAKTYRIHDRLGQPCPVCETPIARVDFEEHTIYYCPECQTGGRVLKDRRLSRLLR